MCWYVKEKNEIKDWTTLAYPPTSDSLGVWGEHKQFEEAQTERGVVVLPDDSGDQEDFAITGQQQPSEEQAELQGSALQETHHRPEEAEHTAAERRQLYKTNRRTCQREMDGFQFFKQMSPSYRGWPVQTCCRTPIPWCTWWCRRGRCSARSHGAETTWGRPRTAGRTHTTSSGSAEAEEKKHTREENMSAHDSMRAMCVILQVCQLSIPLLLMTYVSSKRACHEHTASTYAITVFILMNYPRSMRWKQLILLTFKLVLNKMCLNACVLHKMASIRMITGSYSMYLSTGFWQDSCKIQTHKVS